MTDMFHCQCSRCSLIEPTCVNKSIVYLQHCVYSLIFKKNGNDYDSELLMSSPY